MNSASSAVTGVDAAPAPAVKQLVWLHHEAEEYLDAYIAAAGIDGGDVPLFQSLEL